LAGKTRLFAHWAALLILALSATAVRANPPKGYPFVDYSEGLRQARAEHKQIFMYFGRFGCGWCAKTNRETFSNPALRKLYISHYVLVYVDGKRPAPDPAER